MNYISYYDNSGQYTYVTFIDDYSKATAPHYKGKAEIGKQYHDFGKGKPVDYPERPSFGHTFDYTTKQWVDQRSLEDHKKLRWAEIKKERALAEYAGFSWDGLVFDSDELSQRRITSAVILAQMTPTFLVEWTLQDNTTVELSQDSMFLVGAALGSHVSAQFTKASILRSEIEQCSTIEGLNNIVWTIL
jgi:hypothetical protein